MKVSDIAVKHKINEVKLISVYNNNNYCRLFSGISKNNIKYFQQTEITSYFLFF